MKSAGVYLTFAGNCADAFEHYEKVFGKKVCAKMTYRESPMKDKIDEEHLGKILHTSLDIGLGSTFAVMGCDTNPIMRSRPLVVGTNNSVVLTPDTLEETKRLFQELSKDGEVTMPLDKQFWGSYFGTLVDAFGIHWMLDFPIPIETDDEKKEEEEGGNKRKEDVDVGAATPETKKAKS